MTIDVALDADGTLYVADYGINCQGPAAGANSVRSIDRNGIITTVVGGTGLLGFGGDGGPAAKATINGPAAVAVDRPGNLYISDQDNYRIRRVDADGTITTIAGTGQQGHTGDGGPARSARLMGATGMAFDAHGNLYLADFAAVRKIDPAGTITTVAGTGRWHRRPDPEHLPIGPRTRFAGEGGPATEAVLLADDVAFDRDGSLHISDEAGGRVYRVNADGIITTVAGTVSGKGRRLGDGGPATQAFIDVPTGVEIDRRGNLLIADHHGERIRKVDSTGTITTIAGTGIEGFSGEHGTATKLQLSDPTGMFLGPPGTVYLADMFNARVRALRYDRSDR